MAVQRRARSGFVWAGLLALVVAPVVAVAVQSQPVAALTTIAVTSNADTGANTLRAALTTANTTNDAIEIDVQAGLSPITLASALPVYTGGGGNNDLTIVGNGVTVNGFSGSDVLSTSSTGTVTLNGVTFVAAGGGSGIDANGAVTVTNSTLTGGASSGDGISASGAVSVTGSTITGSGSGDGISNGGSVSVTSSTITGGATSGDGISSGGSVTVTGSTVTAGSGIGDGISNGGSVTATSSTIIGGGSNGDGISSGGSVTLMDSMIPSSGSDGISNDGPVVLTNSTIAQNASDGVSSGGSVTLTNSTITGNHDNGISGGAVTLVYSDVVGNAAATSDNNISASSLTTFGSVVTGAGAGNQNCAIGGTKTSHGSNFSDDTSCGFTATGDTQGSGNNPHLGALAANGGPTQTLLPQTGSPLIDAIPTANCQSDGASGVTTDQRGITRPQGAGCDIGSVEIAVTVPTPTPAPAPTPAVVQPAFTG
jgi:hypothetical protein